MRGVVLYPYDAESRQELTLREDEIVTDIVQVEPGWLRGNIGRRLVCSSHKPKFWVTPPTLIGTNFDGDNLWQTPLAKLDLAEY